MSGTTSQRAGVLVVFDDVFGAWECVFMCDEYDFSSMSSKTLPPITAELRRLQVGHRRCAHRRYPAIAEYNGARTAAHIRDKIGEMIHLAETMHGCGLAGFLPLVSRPAAGNYQPDTPHGQRLQAERDPLPLRAMPAGRGHHRRPDRHYAVGEGLPLTRRRQIGAEVPQRRTRGTHRGPLPHGDPYPRHELRPGSAELPDRVHARRRLTTGAEDHDRAQDGHDAKAEPGSQHCWN